MRELLVRVMRRSVVVARSVASQVAVSVLATACMALVTNAYLRPEPQAVQVSVPRLASADPQAAASLLDAAFSPKGIRVRSTLPGEFAAVFGPTPEKAFITLTSTEWSEPVAAPAAQAAAPAVQIAQAPRPQTAVEAGDGAARPVKARRVVALAPAPPVRPETLATVEVRPEGEASRGEASRSETSPSDERLSVLGLPLPGFVASGSRIVKTAASTAVSTVASWGGSLTGHLDAP